MNEGKPMPSENRLQGHVIVAADTNDTMRKVEQMFSRFQVTLTALQTFVDNMSELDEDAPDLATQAGPHLEELMLKFIEQYQTPDHLQVDLDTLRRMVIQPSIQPKGGH